MPERIPQSVALEIPFKAYMADGVTVATGKTIAITISKNHAAFGNPNAGATNASEIANGWYYLALDTTDTGTAGILIIHGTATGVESVDVVYRVVNAYNAGFSGVPNAAADAAGGLPISDAGGLDLDTRIDVAISSRLAPTVAARTLDVSTTGEAGLDFDNIKAASAPTTLTNITVPLVTTTTTATTVTNAVTISTGTGAGQLDVTSGRIKADTVYWNAAAVVAPSTAGTPNVNLVAWNNTAPLNLTSQRVNCLVGSMSNNVLTAAAIAANAIDAATFAADVDAEIAAYIWNAAKASYGSAGSYGELAELLESELAKVPKSDSTVTWNATALASVNAQVVDVLTTDTIPDSYAAHEAQPTFAQAVLGILQFLTEKSVTSTTVSVAKPDGTTAVMEFTLDSATAPTSITRKANP